MSYRESFVSEEIGNERSTLLVKDAAALSVLVDAMYWELTRGRFDLPETVEIDAALMTECLEKAGMILLGDNRLAEAEVNDSW